MLDDNVMKLEISPAEVEQLLQRPSETITLVDVREEWELTRGILPGALHVPLSRFGEFVDAWQPAIKYVIYCEHGVRSLDAAAWLAGNKGISAVSMQGGFSVWSGPVAKFVKGDSV